MKSTFRGRFLSVAALAAVLSGGGTGLLATCGPFTDTPADAFCPFILEVFYLAVTTGTTPTTYAPGSDVTRLQMVAFLSRTVDGVLKRSGRRASLNQLWTAQNESVLGLTTVGSSPQFVRCDGADIWVGNYNGNTVSRVRASDGRLLETWTGADAAQGVLVAMNRVLVAADTGPGRLYRIDPSQPAGAVTTVASNLGTRSFGIAFDGARVWTANLGLSGDGTVSIVTPGAAIPWTVTTVTVGAGSTSPAGAVFDGANIWVADNTSGKILKLDASGAVLQTVTVGANPFYPRFDGSNIWVPDNGSNSVTVVRAASGTVLQTLTGNGLVSPLSASFDGERILVTNYSGGSVSLWKAADLTPLGSFSIVGTNPYGVCSDGIRFWIALSGAGKLARF